MQISEPINVFEITFTVDKAAALKAGRSRWGDVKVQIDPAELTEAERAILLRGIDKLPWDRSAPGRHLISTGNNPPAELRLHRLGRCGKVRVEMPGNPSLCARQGAAR